VIRRRLRGRGEREWRQEDENYKNKIKIASGNLYHPVAKYSFLVVLTL